MEIKPLSPSLDPLKAPAPPSPTQAPATLSAAPVEPAARAAKAAPDPERPAPPPPPARPATRLLVEIDPDSGVFIRRIIDAASGDEIAQYPTEARLAFARSVTAELRRTVDVKA